MLPRRPHAGAARLLRELRQGRRGDDLVRNGGRARAHVGPEHAGGRRLRQEAGGGLQAVRRAPGLPELRLHAQERQRDDGRGDPRLPRQRGERLQDRPGLRLRGVRDQCGRVQHRGVVPFARPERARGRIRPADPGEPRALRGGAGAEDQGGMRGGLRRAGAHELHRGRRRQHRQRRQGDLARGGHRVREAVRGRGRRFAAPAPGAPELPSVPVRERPVLHPERHRGRHELRDAMGLRAPLARQARREPQRRGHAGGRGGALQGGRGHSVRHGDLHGPRARPRLLRAGAGRRQG